MGGVDLNCVILESKYEYFKFEMVILKNIFNYQ